MQSKIRVAIAGIGNCASSFIQGISYYSASNSEDPIGLMYTSLGGYTVGDIELVAAFDVDARKVGKDVAEAIFAAPNCAKKFCDVSTTGVIVDAAPVLDGVAPHMLDTMVQISTIPACNVAGVLRASGAEMLICYLPVGSAAAARFYAEQCLLAGVGFINAIPEFICSDDDWIHRFKDKGLPCAGDDIKSQVGATILHRVIARLIYDRGQIIDSTYQLNIGGNADFYNMIDEARLISKRKSKTQAVTSILEGDIKVKIGPSDYVEYLQDNKVCYINIKGRQFGNVPFEVDVKLSVEDSPNSAGVMVDVVRTMKLALDNGISGNLEAISACAFKSPRTQYRDEVAMKMLEDFINNPRLVSH